MNDFFWEYGYIVVISIDIVAICSSFFSIIKLYKTSNTKNIANAEANVMSKIIFSNPSTWYRQWVYIFELNGVIYESRKLTRLDWGIVAPIVKQINNLMIEAIKNNKKIKVFYLIDNPLESWVFNKPLILEFLVGILGLIGFNFLVFKIMGIPLMGISYAF